MTKQEPKRLNRLLFILNNKSGTGDKTELPDKIEAFCLNNQFDFQIQELTKELSEEKALQLIADFKPDAVIAAGGDGTVNFVGNLVLNKDIVLGIIPLGSANGFAKNIYISEDVDEALGLFVNPNLRAVDALDVNGRLVLHLMDIGLNALLVKRFSKLPFRGMFAYLYCLVVELSRLQRFPFEVVTEERRLKDKAIAMTITNTRMYGTEAAINPTGKIDDGKFEICIFDPPMRALPYMTYRLFKEEIHKTKYARFIRTSEAVIHNVRKEAIHIDGEPMELGRELRVTNLKHALTVIAPEPPEEK